MRHDGWPPRLLVFFACSTSLLLASQPARGVVAAKSKLSTFYAQSRFVATGKVAAVNGNVVDVNSVEVLKGVPPKVAGMKVKVEQPADLAGRLKAGDAVVVFDQEALCLVHAGDTWLVAKAAARGPNPAFVAQGVHPERELFPGRTAGLAAAVTEIKAGKSTLLNEFHQDVFSGGVKELGRTVPNASFAVAADVNGDGKGDLLVGNAQRVQLFLSTGDGLKDATAEWGLSAAKGAYAAAGDLNGDGKADFVIGGELWLNTGSGFKGQGPPAAPAADTVLAAAVADADGDGRAEVLTLTAAGALAPHGAEAKPLWSGDARPAVAAAFSTTFGDDGKPAVLALHPGGPVRYGIGAAAAPPADAERLTGKKPEAGGEVIAAVALDVNGDGREDFLTVTRDAGDLLINRGFGTFLLDPGAGKLLRSRGQQKVPFEVGAATRLVGADLHGDKFDDLVVVTPEGTLYELNNPPQQAKP